MNKEIDKILDEFFDEHTIYQQKKIAEEQYEIGAAYYHGAACMPKDFKEAKKWLLMAVSLLPEEENWYADAHYMLAEIYLKYFYDGIEQELNKIMAMHCFRIAAELGHQKARFKYGAVYYHGAACMPKDFKEAQKWLLMAVSPVSEEENWYAAACYMLAEIHLKYFDDGIDKEQNKVMVMHFFRIAAGLGYPEAQFKYGGAFYKDVGIVEQNQALGVYWINKAADQRHPTALFFKAIIHLNSNEMLGIQKNLALAKKLYNLSLSQGYIPSQKAIDAISEIFNSASDRCSNQKDSKKDSKSNRVIDDSSTASSSSSSIGNISISRPRSP